MKIRNKGSVVKEYQQRLIVHGYTVPNMRAEFEAGLKEGKWSYTFIPENEEKGLSGKSVNTDF
ncbi:hypothetical protein [Metabacillus idriensis]|uniref:hypothetical protein n=1 Tax=Metabacillus idriensis TaxID=324768 RepID=UPI00174A8521|nr:hypothetical protein [Metabacillus idriensis]